MKFAAAFGALSSKSSMSMSPRSVAMVAEVIGPSPFEPGSGVGDRGGRDRARVGGGLAATGGREDRIGGLHPRCHVADDLVGVVGLEDVAALVVEAHEELRAVAVRVLRPG